MNRSTALSSVHRFSFAPMMLFAGIILVTLSGCASLTGLGGNKARDTGPVTPKEVKYQCAEDYGFVLTYGAYQIGDKTIKLRDHEVMFSDYQHFIASSLHRTRNRPPVKYANGSIKLVIDDNSASIKLSDHSIKFSDCALATE